MKLKEIGDKQFLGKGNFSKCYLLEDGNVLKLFNTPKKLYEMDKFKYFLNYSNDSFIFPFEFIYDFRKFYGYITKKASGKNLDEVFSNSNLLDLSINSYKLEKDIDLISSGGIILYDVHGENVLYGDNQYSVIDHDENAITDNIGRAKSFNNQTHRILICNLFLDNLNNIKVPNLIKDDITKCKYTDIKPSEIIIKVKEDIEKYYKQEIDTLEDVKKLIRR